MTIYLKEQHRMDHSSKIDRYVKDVVCTERVKQEIDSLFTWEKYILVMSRSVFNCKSCFI